ncbi:hypothetical protein [Spiroplasma sp. SV19]|uniref:hypothetical protein n=1 Tax=Spiroplasma sp. SV19 TaxID=2570468 RepID=UPI0024B726B9|nr:hypothetical protein [Spiroplasma sp. SV19]
MRQYLDKNLYTFNCHNLKDDFCHRLIIFHNTRKGRVNGYRKLKFAFIKVNKNQNKGYLGENLSKKEMYKIMKDHNLHDKNRTGMPYLKGKSLTKSWNKNMDLIKGNFKNTLDLVISMDIKYVATNEGYVYFNWVKDFGSQAIIGEAYSSDMSYLNLV